jgi:hypothetical protein
MNIEKMNVILMSYDHIGFPMQYGLFQLAARQILFTEFHPQNIFQMMTRTLQTSIKQSIEVACSMLYSHAYRETIFPAADV